MGSRADFDVELPERVRGQLPRFRWVLREAGFWYSCMLFGPVAAAAILGFSTVSSVVAGICGVLALASAWYFLPRFWFMFRFMEALEKCDREAIVSARSIPDRDRSAAREARGRRYAQLSDQLGRVHVPRESRQAMAGFRASIDDLVAAYGADDDARFEVAADAYVRACRRVWGSSRLNKDEADVPDGPLSRIHA